MKISYGPPGAVGVKALQYVGEVGDDADYVSLGLHSIAKPVGALALGAWAYAWVTKKPQLKKMALGVSIAAFIVQLATKP